MIGVKYKTPRLNVIKPLDLDPILSKSGEVVVYNVSHEGEQTYLQVQQAYIPIDIELSPSIQFDTELSTFLEGSSGEILITRTGDLSQNSVVNLYILGLDAKKTSISVEDLINSPRVSVLFYADESSKSIDFKSILNYGDTEDFDDIALALRPFINAQIGSNSVTIIQIIS